MALSFENLTLGSRGWICIDLSPNKPMLYTVDKLPFKFEKNKKPIKLFFDKNFKNSKIKSFEIIKNYGRLIIIELTDEKTIELSLFTKAVNITLISGNKRVSLNKPKKMEEVSFHMDEASWGRADTKKLTENWINSFGNLLGNDNKKKSIDSSSKANTEKNLKKHLAILKKLEVNIKTLEAELQGPDGITKVINQLNISQDINVVPEQYKKDIKGSLEYGSLLNFLYDLKGKKENKIKRAKNRKEELERSGTQLKVTPKVYNIDEKLRKEVSKSKRISSEITLLWGKSARENINLLRKSKPWYYWFHLKDRPSSHLIASCPKNYTLSANEINLIANFFVDICKVNVKKEGAVEVMWAEKRYVNPIKGDKVGRVKVHQFKTTFVK